MLILLLVKQKVLSWSLTALEIHFLHCSIWLPIACQLSRCSRLLLRQFSGPCFGLHFHGFAPSIHTTLLAFSVASLKLLHWKIEHLSLREGSLAQNSVSPLFWSYLCETSCWFCYWIQAKLLILKNLRVRDKCWIKGKMALLRQLEILARRWTHVPKNQSPLLIREQILKENLKGGQAETTSGTEQLALRIILKLVI